MTKAEQIENTINNLLDAYDDAMTKAKAAKGITKENEHKDIAFQVVECIEHEMKKLRALSSFEEEIKLVTVNH